ncbi:MAG: hypothetical protein SFV19_06955 [Rhodospirillaceae bacterium]|nr:hypothetical protein [Rhodospirillaceae bacterium]
MRQIVFLKKYSRAFSGEVGFGSPTENAPKQGSIRGLWGLSGKRTNSHQRQKDTSRPPRDQHGPATHVRRGAHDISLAQTEQD